MAKHQQHRRQGMQQLLLAALLLLGSQTRSTPSSFAGMLVGAQAAGAMLPDDARRQAAAGGGDDDDGGGAFPLNSLNTALMRRLQMDHVTHQTEGSWIPTAGAAGSGARHYRTSGAAGAALAAAAAAAGRSGGGGGGAGGGAVATVSAAQLEAPPLLTRAQVLRALELAVKLGAANGSLLAATTRGARFAGQLGGIAGRAAALAVESRPERVVALLGELHVELQRLPPGTSWPAVRRVITAGLALHRLRAGPLAAAGELVAVQLLLRLYLSHRAAAKAKRVVEFAHVSKSGGTTLCRLAERNGCRTESFSTYRNCLVPKFDDRPRYIDYAYHRAQRPRGVKTRCDRPPKTIDRRKQEVSCRRRRKIMLQHGYNLYMNEYTAMGGAEDPSLAHACGNMLTALQLRHPYSRVLSHVKHMWHAYTVHCRDDRHLYFPAGHNATHWARLLAAPLDNYLVRSLAGEGVFGLASGGVRQEHMALARVLLMQQYDVLLVLEDPSISHTALSYGLGWAEQELHVNSAQARGPEPGNDDGLPPDPEILYELNRLDLELYRFGVAMAQLDAVVYDAAQVLGTAGASLAALQAAAEEEEAEQDYGAGLEEEDYAEDEEEDLEAEDEGGGEDYVDDSGRDQRGDSSAALTDDEGLLVEPEEQEERQGEAGGRRQAIRARAGAGEGVAAGAGTGEMAQSGASSSSDVRSSSSSSGGHSAGSNKAATVASRHALRRRTLVKESVPPAALTPRQRAALGCGFVGQYEPRVGGGEQ